VRVLPDTHLLLRAAGAPHRLSSAARELLDNPANAILFSVVSIWEIAIKASLQRPDFEIDVPVLRRGLLDSGYAELEVTGLHAIEAGSLPRLHRDPFDRMLIAQARIEGVLLLTADRRLAAYHGPIRLA
jgi:PIN domain nuclease of toxin-antitoxin system